MNVMLIIKIVLAFIVTSVIPFITAIVNGVKKSKKAKTEAEKEKAINDMNNQLMSFINDAESLYKEVNAVLKEKDSSAGILKKEHCLTKLQAYALENGYEYNAEYWSLQNDKIVELTKSVNV